MVSMVSVSRNPMVFFKNHIKLNGAPFQGCSVSDDGHTGLNILNVDVGNRIGLEEDPSFGLFFCPYSKRFQN